MPLVLPWGPGIPQLMGIPKTDRSRSMHREFATCMATHEVRSRIYPELMNCVVKVQPLCSILRQDHSPETLTQFLLDCSSLSLPDSFRIPAHNPEITSVYKISRDWSFAISKERSRLLRHLSKNWKWRRYKSVLFKNECRRTCFNGWRKLWTVWENLN